LMKDHMDAVHFIVIRQGNNVQLCLLSYF
ncbi:hypothetical protein BAE44_0024271, partial [Dichanthelium oligosanthes]